MEWLTEIEVWIQNPKNADQENTGKTNFIRTAKAGEPSKLRAVGISNGVLKKKASEVYKQIKDLSIREIEEGLTQLWTSGIAESIVFSCYLLSKYKKKFDLETWGILTDRWVPLVDSWISSDHLCIELFGHFPLLEDAYLNKLQSWSKSENFWERRLSVTAFLKHSRKNPEVVETVINQIDKIIRDKNYYVRKAIPWILRELTKVGEGEVHTYTAENVQYLTKTELREIIKRMPKDDQGRLLKKYQKIKNR